MNKLYQIFDWRLKNLILQVFKLRNNVVPVDLSKVIIVFGSGRSGTSWLSEVIRDLTGGKILDEPLKRTNSHKVNKLGLVGWGQYLPEDEPGFPEFEKFLQRIVAIKELNPNHIHDLSRLFSNNIWVIKFIRSHLWIPWFVKHVNTARPIYLVRNPYSVVSSQLRHPGWGKGRGLKDIPAVDFSKFRYYEMFYQQYEDLYAKVKTLEEYLTFVWILENRYLLEHPDNNKSWLTLKYENLVAEPEIIKSIISSEYSLPLNPKAPNYQNPSYSKVIDADSINHDIQSTKWKAELNKDQINNIERFLALANADKWYEVD